MRKNIALGILSMIIVLLVFYVYFLRLEVAEAFQANIDCEKMYRETMDSLKMQSHHDDALLIGLDEVAHKKLKKKGFENPEQEIIEDLLQQDIDIPVSGILGGKMRIYEVKLLNEQWAMAYIEDGHIAGEILLEFKVKDNKKVDWKVLHTLVK